MNKYAGFGLVAVTAVVLDQLTKWYIRSTMPMYTSITVIDSFFHLIHVQNPGGAFSFLADFPEAWRRPFFLVVAVIAMGGLFYMVRSLHEEQRFLTMTLGGILGGALGNFLDRLRLGGVTDFLDFQFGSYHWPAFNVADSFISVGIVVLIFFMFFGEEPEESC